MVEVFRHSNQNIKTSACTPRCYRRERLFFSPLEETHSEVPRCEVHFRRMVGSPLLRPGSRISAPAVYLNQILQIIALLHSPLSMHGRLSSCGLLPPGMKSNADSVNFARVNF